jgi:hypothetical protein
MGKKTLLGIISTLVLLGASASLYLSLYGLPPRIDPRPHRALGRTLASEALKLGGPGARVIVIARDTEFYRNPDADEQLKALTEAIVKGGGTVSLANKLKVDPLRVMSVPPGDFLQILKKATEKDVVVSLLGPPVFTREQVTSLQGKALKVIAVCTGNLPRQNDLKQPFDQGILKVAVVSKKGAQRHGPATEDTQTWFDHLYALVTPANVAEFLSSNSPRL